MSKDSRHSKGVSIPQNILLHQEDDRGGVEQKGHQTGDNGEIVPLFISMLIGALTIIGNVKLVDWPIAYIVGGLFLTGVGLAACQFLLKQLCVRIRGKRCVKERNRQSGLYEIDREFNKSNFFVILVSL